MISTLARSGLMTQAATRLRRRSGNQARVAGLLFSQRPDQSAVSGNNTDSGAAAQAQRCVPPRRHAAALPAVSTPSRRPAGCPLFCDVSHLTYMRLSLDNHRSLFHHGH